MGLWEWAPMFACYEFTLLSSPVCAPHSGKAEHYSPVASVTDAGEQHRDFSSLLWLARLDLGLQCLYYCDLQIKSFWQPKLLCSIKLPLVRMANYSVKDMQRDRNFFQLASFDAELGCEEREAFNPWRNWIHSLEADFWGHQEIMFSLMDLGVFSLVLCQRQGHSWIGCWCSAGICVVSVVF